MAIIALNPENHSIRQGFDINIFDSHGVARMRFIAILTKTGSKTLFI